jgi:hypothetical protein
MEFLIVATAKRGRPVNTVGSKSLNLKLNEAAREYLETIARAGTYGNNWTDVAHRFIGDGIERAIRRAVIPRRKLEVSYPTENEKGELS